MATNAVTSKSSTVVAVGTDVTFSASYKAGPRGIECNKVFVMVKFTKVTNNLTLTFGIIQKRLSATDVYKYMFLTADDDVAPLTVTLSASGNVRIPIELAEGEDLVTTLVFAGTGAGDTVVIEYVEE